MSRPLALVTGASRGIGRASAVALAEAGYDIAGWFRSSSDAALETAAAVASAGGAFHPLALDVSNETEVRAGFRTIRKEVPAPLRAVVCAAGITRDGLAGTMAAEAFDSVLATNLRGCFLLCREAIKAMRRSGGTIVLVSSVAGLSGQAGQANYSASKGGINAMTQALAKETASMGIRVNAVAPGYTQTDMFTAMDPAARARVGERVPMGRPGQPAEIAAAICFLSQDASSYITGQILAVDGGMTA
jgi:3-oxoacyl-[acyl-carrier protein] reductase